MENTLSIHVGGNYSVMHNNRITEKHSNPDIDVERSKENIILIDEPIKEKYEEIFKEAVNQYNEKQKRSSRKIENYYKQMRDSENPEAKEVIFEIGNKDDIEKMALEENCQPWETKEWQLRTETLKQYVQDFQKNNPSLVIFNAAIHLDEKNPHAHIDFIPVAENMKKGPSRQVSMNGALADMGYNKTKTVTLKDGKEKTQADNNKNFSDWREKELSKFKAVAKNVYRKNDERFEFIEGAKREHHLSVEEFKKLADQAKEKVTKDIAEEVEQLFENLPDKMTQDDFILTQDYVDTILDETGEPDIKKFSPVEYLKNIFHDFKNFFSKAFEKLRLKEAELFSREEKLFNRECDLLIQEHEFTTLESKMNLYKHELLDRLEPIYSKEWNDGKEAIEIFRSDEYTLDDVLDDFNKDILELQPSQEMEILEEEISDADKVLEIYSKYHSLLENPTEALELDYRDLTLEEQNKIKDLMFYDENEVTIPGSYAKTEIKIPWSERDIKDFKKKRIKKLNLLKENKSNFINALSKIPTPSAKLLLRAAKGISRGISR